MGATLESRLPMIAAELRPRIGAAIKAGAEAIADEARARVPVSDTAPHIRDRIASRRTGPAEYRVSAGDGELFYGYFLERGTQYIAPQPFLEPALDEERDAIDAGITAILQHL